MNCEKLRKRYLALKGERSSSDLEGAWDDIEKYVRPFSGSMYQSYKTEGENQWKRSEIYNSTAVIAADSLAASIQGLLVNPADKWFESTYRVEKLNRDDAAKEYLELSDDAVYQALTQSNFDVKAAEFFLDIVTYGTAIVVEEPRDEDVWMGLDFNAIPVRDIYYEVDADGEIVYLFRRLMWTPLQIMEKFADEHGNGVPDYVKEKAAAGDVREKMEVVFSIFPRKDKVDTGEIANPEDRPWGKKYFILQGAEMLGDEGGYYEMPAFAALWKSVSTSKWGRSPAMDVLADILNVNEWQKIQRNAAAKSVDPSIIVTDRGLLSDLDLSPGGLTVAAKKDSVTVLESGVRMDFSMEEIRNMEENINQAFMQDRLALKESPAMTATEVAARREFMMRSITQPLAILQRNFLDRMIRRTYRILYRAGQLPEVPEIVRQSNSETDIHYNGPLPRTQKAQVVQAEMQYLQYVMSLKELDPEIDDLIDKDAMLKNIAINLGVPALDIRSEEEVAKIRRERAAAMEKQAELERINQAGAAMEQLARGTNAVEQVPATQAAIGALQQ